MGDVGCHAPQPPVVSALPPCSQKIVENPFLASMDPIEIRSSCQKNAAVDECIPLSIQFNALPISIVKKHFARSWK